MMVPVGDPKSDSMTEKADVLQGTLALMALKTLDVLGPLQPLTTFGADAGTRGFLFLRNAKRRIC